MLLVMLFMEKFNLWIARHKLLAFLLLVPTTTLSMWYIFAALETPKIVLSVFLIVWFLIFSIGIWGIEIVLLDKPAKAFDEICDPVSYYEIITTLLSYKPKTNQKNLLLINYSSALCGMGEYEKAFEILKEINIDLIINLDVKLVYYYNLAVLCDRLGKTDEAVIWYQKVIDIYNAFKESKTKNRYTSSCDTAIAKIAVIGGEYERALEIFEKINASCKREKVGISLSSAKLYLKLNNIEKAKEKLNYVIVNGNKLYAVTEAKQLLEKANNI